MLNPHRCPRNPSESLRPFVVWSLRGRKREACPTPRFFVVCSDPFLILVVHLCVDIPESFKKIPHSLITCWIKALPATGMKCRVLCRLRTNGHPVHCARRNSRRRTFAGRECVLVRCIATVGTRRLEIEHSAERRTKAFLAVYARGLDLRALVQPNPTLHATLTVIASPGCACACFACPASRRSVGVQPRRCIVTPAIPHVGWHRSASGFRSSMCQPAVWFRVESARCRRSWCKLPSPLNLSWPAGEQEIRREDQQPTRMSNPHSTGAQPVKSLGVLKEARMRLHRIPRAALHHRAGLLCGGEKTITSSSNWLQACNSSSEDPCACERVRRSECGRVPSGRTRPHPFALIIALTRFNEPLFLSFFLLEHPYWSCEV